MTHLRRGGLHTRTASIRIAAPPETVWEFITTVDNVCGWYDTWDTVENDTIDPRMRFGTSFQLTRHRRGRDETARCRVTDLIEPTRLCWDQSAPHNPTTSVEFLLIPDTDTGTTELRHTRTWATPRTESHAAVAAHPHSPQPTNTRPLEPRHFGD